jgi:hypothetical protein
VFAVVREDRGGEEAKDALRFDVGSWRWSLGGKYVDLGLQRTL